MKQNPKHAILTLISVILLSFSGLSALAIVQKSPVDTLPEIPITQMPDQATINLRDTDGVVRVINFWATWCAPCITELPTIVGLANDLQDQPAQVILVNQDLSNPKIGEDFLTKRGWDKGVTQLYDDDGKMMRAMGVRGLPATFIVDHKGKVTFYEIGIRNWQDQETRDRLETLIAEISQDEKSFFSSWWPW